MTSRATDRFWKLYHELPGPVQELAARKYRLWRENPNHPSLHFKKLAGASTRFSVRVGNHYRAIGHTAAGGVEWVWIGTHEDYNKILGR
jgi:hypothetical protein